MVPNKNDLPLFLRTSYCHLPLYIKNSPEYFCRYFIQNLIAFIFSTLAFRMVIPHFIKNLDNCSYLDLKIEGFLQTINLSKAVV